MQKPRLAPYLFSVAALTAWSAITLGQTRPMLTFQVKTPDGLAVQNADVSVQPAQPAESVLVTVQGRQVNKLGWQARRYQPFFVTRTNADGQAQAPRDSFENALPAGQVVVSVRAEGYQSYRQTVDLAEQKPIQIVLSPLPPQQ